MSQVTAIGFMLVAGGLLMLGICKRKWVAPWLGVAAGSGGFVAVLSHLYEAQLTNDGLAGQMPLCAALGFLALGAGLVAAGGPQLLPQRMMVGPSVRAQLLRRFLPATFCVVLLEAMLSDVYRRAHPTDLALQAVVQTVVPTLLVTLILFYVARKIGAALDGAEAERNLAQRRVLEVNQELEQRVAERTTQLASVNEGLEREIRERREADQRFRQLAENIAEVFWMSDVEKNRIIYISPGYEAVWGRTCDSLYASPRSWLEAIHPEDQQRVLDAALTKQVDGNYDETFRIMRPDGAVRWIQDRAFPIRDESGKIFRIVGIAEDITGRMHASQAVRESEARKSAVMESALDGILTIDAEGRIVEFNSAAESIFGCGRDAVMGRELAVMFVAPSFRVWFERGLAAQFAAGEGPVAGGRIEITACRADGTEFPAELTLTRFELAGRCMFTLFLRDVTKRKQVEAQIAILVHAAESTAEMICITDMQDRFTFVNRAFQQTYGYPAEEILGKTPAILFSPNNPPTLMPEILTQTRKGSWRGEVLDLRKDGSEFPIELSTSLIYDGNGQVIGLMGVAQDISARKRAEELIRLLADAVQCAQEMISVTDAEDRITFVNESFLQTYGYRREEILGRTPAFLHAPDNPPELGQEIFKQTLGGNWRGEVLNRKKDGTVFPIALSTSPIRAADGRILGLLGVARDISEQRRVERQTTAFAVLGHRLSAATTPSQAAEVILEIASHLFGWDAGYVHLYSSSDDIILPVITVDTVDGCRVPVSESSFTLDPSPLMRLVMREGAQLIDRAVTPPGGTTLVPFGDTQRPSACKMYVPIKTKESVLGVLSIQSYQPHAYGRADLTLLQALADHCGDALHRIEVSEALRATEANYRGIFENATEGIFRTTAEGRYLNVNPAHARMFGYASPEQMISSVTNLHSQTFVSRAAAAELKRLLEAQDFVTGFEAERTRKDGGRFWTTINVRARRDANGALLDYEGTVQDIMERKRAEAILRESEQRFRTLFESSPLGIALHVADGRIIETNLSYQRILGYSAEELRELGVKHITHPEDVEEGQQLYCGLRDGQLDRYEREKRYTHKDGRVVWGRSSVSAIRKSNGELLYIISMLEDITERRKMLETLRESERKLRLIAENTTDVIFAFDMNRQPLYANSAVEQLTGYSFAEIQERKFVNWIHPADQDRMLALWEGLFAGKAYADVEFRLVTKSGQTKWCASSWGPMLDESGRQIGVQGRERDITARKDLEHQVLEISAEQRRRIGHELHDGLGQWLAGIALKTKTLEENLAAEQSSQAGMAKDVVSLLNMAISQTRSLAYEFDPVHVEADGLVAALEKLATHSGSLFGVACIFRCDQQRLDVNAQSGLALYRITQEAIRNAVEHGKARRIEVELAADATQLCLRIRDNGSGSTPQPGAKSGMGLYIMRFRANSINGTLRITSAPGQGTVVTCLAPMHSCLA